MAHRGDRSVEVESQDVAWDAQPVYALTDGQLSQIGATGQSSVTLTISDTVGAAEHVVEISAPASQQVNLTIGWRCDGATILPREGGVFGSPREGGVFGSPDEACIWGYGTLDGFPVAGMIVQIEASDGVYLGTTEQLPNEHVPRYSLLLPNAGIVNGQNVTITGVLDGSTLTRTVPIQLDASGSQQIDLALIGTQRKETLVSAAQVHDIKAIGDTLLVATSDGGGVRYEIDTGSGEVLFLENLLPNTTTNHVTNIEIGADGAVWFGLTNHGFATYREADEPQWITQTIEATSGSISPLLTFAFDDSDRLWTGGTGLIARYSSGVVSPSLSIPLPQNLTSSAYNPIDGTLWFGYPRGAVRYDPATAQIQDFGVSSPLGALSVRAIEIADDGSVWLATSQGVRHYSETISPTWQSLTTADGLISNQVYSVATAPDGSLWIGTGSGVSHYDPAGTPIWQTLPITGVGSSLVAQQDVRAIEVDTTNNTLWIGYQGGVQRYALDTQAFVQEYRIDGPLDSSDTLSLLASSNATVWLCSSGGLSRYDSSKSPKWQLYSWFDIHGSTTRISCDGLAVDGDSLWVRDAEGLIRYRPGADPEWQRPPAAEMALYRPNSYLTSIQDGSIWYISADRLINHRPGATPTWTVIDLNDVLNGASIVSELLDATTTPEGTSIWFLTTQKTVVHYIDTNLQETVALPPEWNDLEIAAIVAAPDGALWFGFLTQGNSDAAVGRYHPNLSPQWQLFTCADGLNSSSGGSLLVDRAGTLWIGPDSESEPCDLDTEFDSLVRVNRYVPGGQNEWESFTLGTRQGPVHFTVDAENTLWAYTATGLARIVPLVIESDLAVQIVDGPQTSAAGEVVQYQVALTNQGQRDADAALTLTLPPETQFQSASIAPATTTPPTWHFDRVPTNGTPISLTVDLMFNGSAGSRPKISATATSPTVLESYLYNNSAIMETQLVDPAVADVRIALVGPPLLDAGEEGTLVIWVDNVGGLDAGNTQVSIALPPELITRGATEFTLGEVSFGDRPLRTELLVEAVGTLPSEPLLIRAEVATDAAETERENNRADALVPTAEDSIQSLFVVAGQQMADRFDHGASALLPKLFSLTAHPRVQGAVLDLQLESADVRNAYLAWNQDRANISRANAVAAAIRDEIAFAQTQYPNLRYLVFVGGDDIIPFYRVLDRSGTFWSEERYAKHLLPNGTVQEALAQGFLLTDDFYTDNNPQPPPSARWTEPTDPLLIPDLASGRLVERPDEIIAAIDAFLEHDGQMPFGPHVVGADRILTWDMAERQCALLEGSGNTGSICPVDSETFVDATLNQSVGLLWNGEHSNHTSAGRFEYARYSRPTRRFWAKFAAKSRLPCWPSCA